MTTQTATTKPTIEELSVDLPVYDPRVQRKEGVDERRVASMAEGFNPAALNVGNLSRRETGSLVIIDSAHRIALCKLVGHPTMTFIIHEGLTLQQEAALFLLLNDFRAPSAISKFLARVVRGDADATAIFGLIESHGWHIQASAEPGCISAVAALQSIYDRAAGALPPGERPEIVDWVLGVVTAAWGHDPRGVHNLILTGLAQLRGRFGDAIQRQKLVSDMQHVGPAVLIGQAKTVQATIGGTHAAAMGRVLAGLHNKRLRTQLLPEWVWTR